MSRANADLETVLGTSVRSLPAPPVGVEHPQRTLEAWGGTTRVLRRARRPFIIGGLSACILGLAFVWRAISHDVRGPLENASAGMAVLPPSVVTSLTATTFPERQSPPSVPSSDTAPTAAKIAPTSAPTIAAPTHAPSVQFGKAGPRSSSAAQRHLRDEDVFQGRQ